MTAFASWNALAAPAAGGQGIAGLPVQGCLSCKGRVQGVLDDLRSAGSTAGGAFTAAMLTQAVQLHCADLCCAGRGDVQRCQAVRERRGSPYVKHSGFCAAGSCRLLCQLQWDA